MPLYLEASYSKKAGLPGYSSHQFALTLKTEIHSAEELQRTSSELYESLQTCVDRELKNVGWLPHDDKGNNAVPNGQNGASNQQASPAWNCSIKQQRLIDRTCREQGIGAAELDGLSQVRFRKPVHALNKVEASGLIDELLDAQRIERFVPRSDKVSSRLYATNGKEVR